MIRKPCLTFQLDFRLLDHKFYQETLMHVATILIINIQLNRARSINTNSRWEIF